MTPIHGQRIFHVLQLDEYWVAEDAESASITSRHSSRGLDTQAGEFCELSDDDVLLKGLGEIVQADLDHGCRTPYMLATTVTIEHGALPAGVFPLRWATPKPGDYFVDRGSLWVTDELRDLVSWPRLIVWLTGDFRGTARLSSTMLPGS